MKRKADYYRLLQAVRVESAWEEWVVFMLEVVEDTARETISTVREIHDVLMDYKTRIRDKHKLYSQDLINSLFMHPYTKTGFVERDLNVTRVTATKYLDTLAEDGFLEKRRLGRSNYYINVALNNILTSSRMSDS